MNKKLMCGMMVLMTVIMSFHVVADTETINGVVWQFMVEEGSVALGGENYGTCAIPVSTAGAISLPAEIRGMPVKRIHMMAFANCENLTAVEIPYGVERIGPCAFESCKNLKSICIPSSVTMIDGRAFADCSSLTELEMPFGVEGIGSDIISSCTRLARLVIPASIKEVSQYSFRGCSSLVEVETPSSADLEMAFSLSESRCSIVKVRIADGTVRIAPRMFWFWEKLSEVSLPESLKEIGNGAFVCCTSLTNVVIPCGVTNIGERAFEDSSLKSIALPSGISEVKDYTFEDCRQLESITLPHSLTNIKVCAFEGCRSLVSLTIPASVSRIGARVFSGCDLLISVRYEGNAPRSGEKIYEGTPLQLKSFVPYESVGWKDEFSAELPERWNERLIARGNWIVGGIGSVAFCTVTNVVEVAKEHVIEVTNVVEQVHDVENVVTVYATNFVDVVVTNVETQVKVVEQVREVENVVTVEKTVENVVTVYATNWVDVVVTNYAGAVNEDAGVVSDEIRQYEPANGFDGEEKRSYNGVAFDEDGRLCGLVQISTAKATKKGVKVGGFVILGDGKKQALKTATGNVVDGFLLAETSVGRIGKASVVVGSDGFRGELDDMTLVSAETPEDAGIVNGSLTVSYFDAKTSKLKTKKATVAGVTAEGVAAGSVKVKGEQDKEFLSVVE